MRIKIYPASEPPKNYECFDCGKRWTEGFVTHNSGTMKVCPYCSSTKVFLMN